MPQALSLWVSSFSGWWDATDTAQNKMVFYKEIVLYTFVCIESELKKNVNCVLVFCVGSFMSVNSFLFIKQQ